MIEQLIPKEFCLKCKGCCRFKEMHSAWAPCLLEEEIQDLLDKKIPPAAISSEKMLLLIPEPEGGQYICPFLNRQDNKCKIYEFRPFECQLYPFLIAFRNKKVLLTVDINCPYIAQHLKSQEFKQYVDYLARFLNSAKQKRLLENNPQIIQAYEEVLGLIELDITK